jgi:hypothetical protein
MKRQRRKIKNHKIVLHRIRVAMGGRTHRTLLVTPCQLKKLNALPPGKEIFLTNFYCYSGGYMHVIRTSDGVQFMPNPYHTREELFI